MMLAAGVMLRLFPPCELMLVYHKGIFEILNCAVITWILRFHCVSVLSTETANRRCQQEC